MSAGLLDVLGTQEDAFGGMNAGLLSQDELLRVQFGAMIEDEDFPTVDAMVQAAITWGIDVSDHNGDVPWGKVWDAHVRFAGIKATEGPYPGGGRFTASSFTRNNKAAKNQGFGRSPYHFLVRNQAKAQMDHFLNVAGPFGAGKIPMLDFEPYPNFPNLTPTVGVLRDSIRYLRSKIGPDITILVYSGKGFMDGLGEPDLSEFNNVRLWDAAYYLGFQHDAMRDLWRRILNQGFKPFAKDRWGHEGKKISQFTSTGHVGGFVGDCNAMRGEWADNRQKIFGMAA